MKKYIVYVSIFVCIMGCEDVPVPDKVGEVLRGEHRLRKLTESRDSQSKVSASFFLFFGNFNRNNSSDASIKFAIQLKDSSYAICSLPLEKIRIKFNELDTLPVMKFRWIPSPGGTREFQIDEIMSNYVRYAVISVRQSDWPIQVSLPLNKE